MDGLQEGAEIGEEGATQQGGPQQQAAQAQQVTGGGAGAGAPEGGPAENARDDYEFYSLNIDAGGMWVREILEDALEAEGRLDIPTTFPKPRTTDQAGTK